MHSLQRVLAWSRPPASSTAKTRELGARLATAAVALPPVCFALWYGPPMSSVLLGLAGALCAFEYYRIVFNGRPPRDALAGVIAAAILPVLPDAMPAQSAAAAFWIVAGAVTVAWLLRLTCGTPAGASTVIGHVLGGLLFSGPALFAIGWIRAGEEGRRWTFALLLVTWSNDACAYAVGRALGRHRLAPAVSPGKTWEGVAGGAFGSSVATALAWGFLLPPGSTLELLALAVGTAVVGPLGDLAKSMVKRAHGVKDSGRWLPGHGGLLDRVDAVLWNALMLAAIRAL